MRKLADNADAIYLATDLDREGEAIAWHLREAIGGDDYRYQRVVFNEITKKAIQEAFDKPRGLMKTGSRPAGPALSWTGWLVTWSRRCCGPRWPVACPPDGCSPLPYG